MGCTGIGGLKIYMWVKDGKAENTKRDTPNPNLIFRANCSTTVRLLKFYILEKTSI